MPPVLEPETQPDKRTYPQELRIEHRRQHMVRRVPVSKVEVMIAAQHPDHPPPHKPKLVHQGLAHPLVNVLERVSRRIVQPLVRQHNALRRTHPVRVVPHPQEQGILLLLGVG